MFFSFPPDFLDLCGGALILIQHELGDLIKLDGGKMFFGGKDWSFWGKGSEIIKKVSELKFLKMSKRGSWGH